MGIGVKFSENYICICIQNKEWAGYWIWPDIRYQAEAGYPAKLSIHQLVLAIETRIFHIYLLKIFLSSSFTYKEYLST